MIGRFLKTNSYAALSLSGLGAPLGRWLEGRSGWWIVGYHRVVDDMRRQDLYPGLAVTRETFERQLDWMGRHFRFSSLGEIVTGISTGEQFAPPRVAVTFDDGYMDNYEIAYPILRRKGVPATFFVISDVVQGKLAPPHDVLFQWLRRAVGGDGKDAERGRRAWHLTVALLNTARGKPLEQLTQTLMQTQALTLPSMMDWGCIQSMATAKMDIGSHTRSHALLPRVSDADMHEELSTSKQILSQRLGQPVRDLAYPDGQCDARTVRAVEHAGYRCAVTTGVQTTGQQKRWALPRSMLWEASTANALGRFSPTLLRAHATGALRLWELARQGRLSAGIDGLSPQHRSVLS